jgi:hypothetical protein
MHIRTLVLSLLVLASLAARAEAKQVRFLGPHPIAARFGGGYCYIEAPHMHVYAPDRPGLYQQVGDEYVFTGDPTPFGYEGERHPYYGHHPVIVEGAPEPVYCLIDGPHFHPWPVPETPDYRIKNGVAFYMAPIPQVYIRPHRVKLVNAEYRPYVAFRPTVEVAPPPEWQGEVWVAGPSVEVHAPGVFVAPPPHVSVEVSAPGIVVGAPPPVVFAPPAPHVVVAAPPPVVFAPPAPRVIVGAPAPVFVGGVRVEHEGHWEHREHEGRWEQGDQDEDRGRWHHDNGKHKGWYK